MWTQAGECARTAGISRGAIVDGSLGQRRLGWSEPVASRRRCRIPNVVVHGDIIPRAGGRILRVTEIYGLCERGAYQQRGTEQGEHGDGAALTCRPTLARGWRTEEALSQAAPARGDAMQCDREDERTRGRAVSEPSIARLRQRPAGGIIGCERSVRFESGKSRPATDPGSGGTGRSRISLAHSPFRVQFFECRDRS